MTILICPDDYGLNYIKPVNIDVALILHINIESHLAAVFLVTGSIVHMTCPMWAAGAV